MHWNGHVSISDTAISVRLIVYMYLRRNIIVNKQDKSDTYINGLVKSRGLMEYFRSSSSWIFFTVTRFYWNHVLN